MKLWRGIGIALMLAWIMARGPSLEALPGEVLNSVLIGFGTAFLLRNMYPGEFSPVRGASKIPAGAKYVGLFVYELVTANLDVARRVLHPDLPIDPAMIEYKLKIENDLAITLLANSITLTPGTLTVDHLEGKNALKIHAIDGAEDPDGVREPIEKWENLLQEIFNGDTE